MGKSQVRTVAPPPQDRVTFFARPPLFKRGKPVLSPFSMAKASSSPVKTTPKLCAPSPPPPSAWLYSPPPPSRFIDPPSIPFPVNNDRSLIYLNTAHLHGLRNGRTCVGGGWSAGVYNLITPRSHGSTPDRLVHDVKDPSQTENIPYLFH